MLQDIKVRSAPTLFSPLLANIALHGMEEALGVKRNCLGRITTRWAVVRYADDFVVFCLTRADAEEAKLILTDWLSQRGLSLSDEKTRIVHLTEGFDFLGFNVRYYPVERARLGVKLLIKPSRKSVEKIREKLRGEWLRLRGQSAGTVCAKLDPIIRGWAGYFRIAVARKTFEKLDHWMYQRAYRYAKRAHPRKSHRWLLNRYWGQFHPTRADNWVFGDKTTGQYLHRFSWTPIKRHVLVKGAASPDDPSLKQYWAERAKKKADSLASQLRRVLARRQNGLCRLCGDALVNGEAVSPALFSGEELHMHHRVPRREGGGNELSNLELRHLYCHQQAHARSKLKRNCDVLA
jgi:RNA-directed DNA polymerase